MYRSEPAPARKTGGTDCQSGAILTQGIRFVRESAVLSLLRDVALPRVVPARAASCNLTSGNVDASCRRQFTSRGGRPGVILSGNFLRTNNRSSCPHILRSSRVAGCFCAAAFLLPMHISPRPKFGCRFRIRIRAKQPQQGLPQPGLPQQGLLQPSHPLQGLLPSAGREPAGLLVSKTANPSVAASLCKRRPACRMAPVRSWMFVATWLAGDELARGA